MTRFLHITFFVVFFLNKLYCFPTYPHVINLTDPNKLINIGNDVFYFVDSNSSYSINDIISKQEIIFKKSTSEYLNFGISGYTYWIMFSIVNSTRENNLILDITYPTIDTVDFFYFQDGVIKKISKYQSNLKYSQIPGVNAPDFLFSLHLPTNQYSTYYIRLHSYKQLQLPIFIGSIKSVLNQIGIRNLIFGIYVGIIIIMIFYNLFIYIVTLDDNYLFYVIYIFFVGLTQVTLNGYGNLYIWPRFYYLSLNSDFIIPILNGYAAILFIRNFLNLKNTYKQGEYILYFIGIIYTTSLFLLITNLRLLSFIFLQIAAMFGSFIAILLGIKVAFSGYKPAKFFLLALGVFLTSVIVFVLRNFSIIPFNMLTSYSLEIGSSLETMLLSFALADKINTYKAEKEQAQLAALSKSEEVRMMLSQQNFTLERMVKKRTEDLEKANLELLQTLKNLQDAQVQLIQAEKMATLGQLTAGIAHEINNPINFVKSNVKPLQMDLYDLIALIQAYEKQLQLLLPAHAMEEIEAIKKKIHYPELIDEIRILLKGIEEGAERTAEIIRGLRIFSRLDESELKKADIHECIDSTLILLNNSIPDDVIVEKHYAQLPLIECYPGKVNQMLMNLLTNAIHAIKSKLKSLPSSNEQTKEKQKIIITTAMEPDGQHIRISVADTGTGMTPEIKQKIFEPFFTTKEVGEGTGLGLPIVYSIVEKHGGKIFVETTYGKGSEFIIILPTTPKPVAQTQEVRD
ncbi:sensor histidine kinase [Thermoflavifilum thermophilum]|uniref:histidine kinase n=1 Tax=Thermoflavifilum thermophilum TaxID=1393122 RepID=A0A1I7NE29_9BACT|nr:7TM diverse intracellular signaling domain-containing protein [Thermoflavifilum thermophilum]SFV32937.1 hypothetical protein SAMN05660895_1503 [Thermoflavifilum thermophilum]